MVARAFRTPGTNRLFALSGNQCAFPGCTNAVTDQVVPGEQPVTLAQRAHIVGVGRQGPRSQAVPLSDDIDAMENLLLLCGEHHVHDVGRPATRLWAAAAALRALTGMGYFALRRGGVRRR